MDLRNAIQKRAAEVTFRKELLPGDDPELAEHVGERATVIDGPRRWRGVLYSKEVYGLNGPLQKIYLLVGKQTLQRLDGARVEIMVPYTLEAVKDADSRFKNWKATGREDWTRTDQEAERTRLLELRRRGD